MTKAAHSTWRRRLALWLANKLRLLASWLDHKTVKPYPLNFEGPPIEPLTDEEWQAFNEAIDGDSP